MTVVQSFVGGKLYTETPKYADLPSNIGEVLLEAISYNTASTSKVIVSGLHNIAFVYFI
jgi:hypothetical protein